MPALSGLLQLAATNGTVVPSLSALSVLPSKSNCWALNPFSPNLFCFWIPPTWDLLHSLLLLPSLQQYVNRELPDVQAGFRKGRGTRDQIANMHWIIEKAREFQKNIYFCFIGYVKAFDCVDHNKPWKILQRDGNIRQPDLPLEKSVCRSRSNS